MASGIGQRYERFFALTNSATTDFTYTVAAGCAALITSFSGTGFTSDPSGSGECDFYAAGVKFYTATVTSETIIPVAADFFRIPVYAGETIQLVFTMVDATFDIHLAGYLAGGPSVPVAAMPSPF